MQGKAPHDSLFNTGNNGRGGVLVGGSQDKNWKFSNSLTGTYLPAIVMSNPPPTFVKSPWKNCTWISHSSAGTHSGSIEQFYKLEFKLPCRDECGNSFDSALSFCLNLDIYVDNSIHEIYINGKPQSSKVSNVPISNPYYNRGFEASGRISFSLCDDWKSGDNEIIFHVRSALPIIAFLAQASVYLTTKKKPKYWARDTSKVFLCKGDSLRVGSSFKTLPGTYADTLYSNVNCDSIIVYVLDYFNVEPVLINTEDTVCQNALPIRLSSTKDSTNAIIWSGAGVIGNYFSPSPIVWNMHYSSAYVVMVQYLDTATLCTSKDTTRITIEKPIDIQILNDSFLGVCANGELKLNAYVNRLCPIKWRSLGDGIFSHPDSIETQYSCGVNDNISPSFIVYVETISGTLCPESADTAYIKVFRPASIAMPMHLEACEPAILNFQLSATGLMDSFIVDWDWGNGNSLIVVNSLTANNILYQNARQVGYDIKILVKNYWGKQADQFCLTAIDSISYVKIHPRPIADFTSQPDGITSTDMPVFKLNNKSRIASGKLMFLWDFGLPGNMDTSTLVNPVINYNTDTGNFNIRLFANHYYQYKGQIHYCSDTVQKQVYIGPGISVFLPNAVFPESGIMHNTEYSPVIHGAQSYKFEIYNRWGELLFVGDELHPNWNCKYAGELCQQEVYLCVLKVFGFDKRQYRYATTFTLLR